MRRSRLPILWFLATWLLAAPVHGQKADAPAVAAPPAGSAAATPGVKTPTAQSPPSQTAAPDGADGEPAPAGEKPLPRMEDLVARMKARQAAAEELRKSYTYRQTVVADDFDSHGNKKGTHSDSYQTWMVKDQSVSQHVEHDGKELAPDQARKEQDRVDREVAAIKDGSYKPGRGNIALSVSNLLKMVTFSNERRVLVNGRPAILFDYRGNPDAKADDIAQQIMRKLTGQLWLDEQDAALVRMQGALNEPFHVAGGLLVNIKAGSRFDIDTSHINGEIWFLHHMQAHADGRFLLVKGFDGDADVTFSDYRKMRTSVTILPGSRVIDDDGKPIPVPAADPAAPPPPSGGAIPGSGEAASTTGRTEGEPEQGTPLP